MLDRPGRSSPRFPETRVGDIKGRISEEVALLAPQDGFASGAAGADILFHESLMEMGRRSHVVLPCNVTDFRRDCVEILPGTDWGKRFERILEKSASVDILGEQYASDNAMASECCNRIMVGLATRKAAESGEQPVLLALWDGRPGDAVGGTHSMVDFCVANGVRVRLMQDLMPGSAFGTRDLVPPLLSASSIIRPAGLADGAAQQICAVMFADAVGYSKLKERDLPMFMRQYLAAVMRAMSAHEIVPLVKNTWGDGLYLVFDSVREAGTFALDFRDAIAKTNWKELGLPHDVGVRIGLHAGPLYRIYDPVLGQWSYIGTNVTHAARIEPSTPSGEVYASLAFAALAAAERVTSFDCRLVGTIDMAKGYGEMLAFKVSFK